MMKGLGSASGGLGEERAFMTSVELYLKEN